MKVYLVQHGESLPKEEDSQRPLSDEGKVGTEKVAQFLKSKSIRVNSVWHSGKMRAIKTAEILSQSITSTKIVEREDLNPLDSVDKFPSELHEMNKDLMIVGHLPFLQRLSGSLLIGKQDSDIVSFTYSGVLCLEYQDRWRIAWFITPDVI